MFNSRNPAFRYPTGAVANCLPVHFKIDMPRDLHCSAARLLVREDSTGETQKLDMFWCGMNGDNHEWWECHFAAQRPGLYFYHFEVTTWRGVMQMHRAFGGTDTMSPEAKDDWQLTVYERSFHTPEWLVGGVMYQVLPDRFFRSGKPKTGVPADRTLHGSWEEEPEWKPNSRGEVTNSDYFGGDLAGIMEKLDYLKSLGVTCLYLNPIFEAHSNHRYNTASYEKIDPLLGNEEDFRLLCTEAKKRGIHVLLDGVFNHTGSDSVYFNREGRYPTQGAYNSQNSPYSSWYNFCSWPDDYECWWNFKTLPDVIETNPEYDQYINGSKGIVRHWIAAGASGWRLDVADELPDTFLDNLRTAAKMENPDALVLGEVWEDASTKSAYGKRRRYLLGDQLDSVMNYPFRNAILGYLLGHDPAKMLEIIMNVLENYPPQVVRLLMNHIGTHDTERALTVLGGEPTGDHGRAWQAQQKLTPEQRELGLKRLKMAAVMQFTLPGVPCIYYGDEVGMEGYKDPFNRGTFPWGHENEELLSWYRKLGKLRRLLSCLKEGTFTPLKADDHTLVYVREDSIDAILVALNAGENPYALYLPDEWRTAEPVFGEAPDRNSGIHLHPLSVTALVRQKRPSPSGPFPLGKPETPEEALESIKDKIMENIEQEPEMKDELMDFLKKIQKKT
ncbi:glycoside hydrolase family 13 protein [Caproicibacterium lactatifermentans]|jgi:glycosidase|uniref:Glycoside hydrolase family 13 protein n=1 Tax=Caproicibacterium lactatifermentans TaxID=2666138 RepID=A0A859DMU0_9FIRM|nr:glycoside hydrolase family 13 protein [Caproicibacterium lactatifermentans]ARP49467.1 alpha-glycosidase [Ruminococcaceae bacterium CPB6]MDD4808034.1 glycoside hydrolase family 13 protein [Oscillospiraceae bacterium]QKN23060.1 glycoside hydrolase family 13 protein [Caproicibacterium lactatifermentans]QKO30334.1 glycoside hydrolase family 13 protein [Caproicibacterium lactatifermentans]